MAEHVPYEQIVSQLDIEAGDTVYIASNIVRLSMNATRNEGAFDPMKFLESIQNKVTPSGTVVLPAFNFSVGTRFSFDPATTTPATGALPEAAFASGSYARTRHPLHSFLVRGARAEVMCAMTNDSSFGSDSPFGALHEHGKMLAIDLDLQHSLSQAHYVEESQSVSYRRWKTYRVDVAGSGIQEYRLFHKKLGWVNNLSIAEKAFETEGISRTTVINGISFTITDLPAADSRLTELYQEHGNKALANFSLSVYLKQFIKTLLGKPTI